MTIYLVLPPEHMRAQSALLRMWIGSLLNAVIRGGLQEVRKTYFVLDEAASLGHLEPVDDAIDKYRAYGIRLLFAYQNLGQLRKCFPDGQDQVLLANTTQVFFGCNDYQTAEYISNRTGDCTISVESGGSSYSKSSSWSGAGQPTTGGSDSHNANSNWQQQARKLVKPEEVLSLPPDVAITFVPGCPPIRTRLIRYYEEQFLGRRSGFLGSTMSALSTLIASFAACLVSLVFAGALTLMVQDMHPGSMPQIDFTMTWEEFSGRLLEEFRR